VAIVISEVVYFLKRVLESDGLIIFADFGFLFAGENEILDLDCGFMLVSEMYFLLYGLMSKFSF